MNILKQAEQLGIQMCHGSYLTISKPNAKTMFLDFLNTAAKRIDDERATRRANVMQIATTLVLAGKIDVSSASTITKAMERATNIDEENVLVREQMYSTKGQDVAVDPPPYSVSYGAKVQPSYTRMHIRSGGKTEELGHFLVVHGAFAYCKKLKSINQLIAATKMAILYDSEVHVDLATISGIEFINSTAFERYNESYYKLIEAAMDAKEDEDGDMETIEEGACKSA